VRLRRLRGYKRRCSLSMNTQPSFKIECSRKTVLQHAAESAQKRNSNFNEQRRATVLP